MTTPSLDDMAAMAKEPLAPELVPYVSKLPVLGPFCRHPLVFGPVLVPGMLNRALRYKTERLAEAMKDRDWSTAMWLHERPYRLPTLAEWYHTYPDLPLDTMKTLLMAAWMDTEFPHQFGFMPLSLFVAAGFITDAPNLWAVLGNRLTVYRGDTARPTPRRGSLSWTLARGCAEWFARRWTRGTRKRPQLWAGTISKEHALGYIEARGECEVIVSPRHVRDLHPETMGRDG